MISIRRMLVGGVIAAGALGAAGMAQARDVYWSVGVGGPGVSVGVGNAPRYYAPQPVYVEPAPVYMRPRPVYVAPPPVYYGPPQVVYRPARGYGYYGPPGHYKHRKHRHHRHERYDRDDYRY